MSTAELDDTTPPTPKIVRASVELPVVSAAVVLLLLAGSWPSTMFPSWTPRMMAVAIVGLPGCVMLVRRTVNRDVAAMLASVVGGWFVLTATISAAPRSSLFGFVGRDMSALVVVLALGCWAVGRSGRENDDQVAVTMLAGTGLLGLLGIVQVVAGIESGFLALQAGRPASLLVNPVYFGAVSAAGCVAGVAACRTEVQWWRAAGIGVLGAATMLSGSRIAMLALVGTLTALCLVRRDRGILTASVVAVFGAVGGWVIDLSTGQGESAAVRLGEQGTAGRFTVWRYGLEAWAGRPLTGHGVGLFRPTVQGRFDADFVREYAPDDLTQPWFDPHNVFVLILTSVGVVGLLLIAAWAARSARGCGGPLAWAAAPMVIAWLLQPVSIHTLPLVLLLFGASYSVQGSSSGFSVHGESSAERIREPADPVADPVSEHRLRRFTPESFAVVTAALLSLWLLVVDLELRRAVDSGSSAAATRAAGWFPDDPVVANIVAQLVWFDERREEAIEWSAEAVEIEPDRPYWWSRLAEGHLELGQYDEAMAAARHALRLQPTNVRANELVLAVGVLDDRIEIAEQQLRVLCELADAWCGVTVDELAAGR